MCVLLLTCVSRFPSRSNGQSVISGESGLTDTEVGNEHKYLHTHNIQCNQPSITHTYTNVTNNA